MRGSWSVLVSQNSQCLLLYTVSATITFAETAFQTTLALSCDRDGETHCVGSGTTIERIQCFDRDSPVTYVDLSFSCIQHNRHELFMNALNTFTNSLNY